MAETKESGCFTGFGDCICNSLIFLLIQGVTIPIIVDIVPGFTFGRAEKDKKKRGNGQIYF